VLHAWIVPPRLAVTIDIDHVHGRAGRHCTSSSCRAIAHTSCLRSQRLSLGIHGEIGLVMSNGECLEPLGADYWTGVPVIMSFIP
jgi:hypothetical protein